MVARRPWPAGFLLLASTLASLLVVISHPAPVHATSPGAGIISTFAGAPVAGPATTVRQTPWGLALSGTNLYIADEMHPYVRVLDLGTGNETIVAGNGLAGATGDGGPAASAEIQAAFGLALDASGNLYIATGDRIRKVTPGGTISTVAGGGASNPGDGGPATAAQLSGPQGVFVDATGNLFIADTGHNRVREVDHTTGVITTVVGTGVAGFNGDLAPTATELNQPADVFVDGSNNLWIADYQNGRVRELASGAATVTTVHAYGTQGAAGVFFDSGGHEYDAVGNTVVKDGSTLIGTGQYGFNGDGQAPLQTNLSSPVRVVVDGSGTVYVADVGQNRVRKLAGGVVTTIAGLGPPNAQGGPICTGTGDGGQASAANLCRPNDLVFDSSGDLFILDFYAATVREVNTAGVINTVAGNGTQGSEGADGTAATSSAFSFPTGIAVDASGHNLYIADTLNNLVSKVDLTTGLLHRFAGGGGTSNGNNIPALSAFLSSPTDVETDSAGNVYITTGGDGHVSKVDGSGTITIVASLPNNARSIAIDSLGNLVVSGNNGTVFRISGGIVSTLVAGEGAQEVEVATGDRILFTNYSQVLLLSPNGVVPLAGNSITGTSAGDGGPALNATLGYPLGLAVDPGGDIFVADSYSYRVREIQAYGTPPAPVGVTATPGFDSVRLSWPAQPNITGLPITTYTVTPSIGAVQQTPYVAPASPGAPVVVVPGLTPGTAYTFTVRAGNAWATGPPSSSTAPVTPVTHPFPGMIVTHAGSVGSGSPTSIAQAPYSIATNGAGDLFIGDIGNAVVRDLSTAVAHESVIAGNASIGYGGVNGPASAAVLSGAGAMADCGQGLYVADTLNFVIRKIDPQGNISTVAGTGVPGYSGDGAPATSAQIGRVLGLSCRIAGGFWLSDSDNNAIRYVDAAGVMHTYWQGIFGFPTGVDEMDGPTPLGSGVFVTDTAFNVVWQLTDSTASVIAGNGFAGNSGDGGSSFAAQLNAPRGLATTWFGLVIADTGNNRLRYIDFNLGMHAYAGDPGGAAGFSGDGGLAAAARLKSPVGVIVGNNVVYVADYGNNRVRVIDGTTTNITTLAGNGTPSLSGDGGPATTAQLGIPYAVAIDSSGNRYVADEQDNVIRKIDTSGLISTFAGNGVAGYAGDGGLATSAELFDPRGVTVDAAGNVYISDTGNQVVRRVDHATGHISTVAGVPHLAGYSGDGGAATSARLNYPRAVAVDGAGNLYIADTANNRVRRVSVPGGVITTYAGNGAAGFSGDGHAATSAMLNGPRGLAFDGSGNLFIGDSNNNRVRKVAVGVITTFAGDGRVGAMGDGGPAAQAALDFPFGLAFDPAGNLYVADSGDSRIRQISTGGVIITVAGRCGPGFSGDWGLADRAQVNVPYGLGVDANGNIFIADSANNRVRVVYALTAVSGRDKGPCPSDANPAGSGASQSPGNPSPIRREQGNVPRAGVMAGFDVLPAGVATHSPAIVNHHQAPGTSRQSSGRSAAISGPVHGHAQSGSAQSKPAQRLPAVAAAAAGAVATGGGQATLLAISLGVVALVSIAILWRERRRRAGVRLGARR